MKSLEPALSKQIQRGAQAFWMRPGVDFAENLLLDTTTSAGSSSFSGAMNWDHTVSAETNLRHLFEHVASGSIAGAVGSSFFQGGAHVFGGAVRTARNALAPHFTPDIPSTHASNQQVASPKEALQEHSTGGPDRAEHVTEASRLERSTQDARALRDAGHQERYAGRVVQSARDIEIGRLWKEGRFADAHQELMNEAQEFALKLGLVERNADGSVKRYLIDPSQIKCTESGYLGRYNMDNSIEINMSGKSPTSVLRHEMRHMTDLVQMTVFHKASPDEWASAVIADVVTGVGNGGTRMQCLDQYLGLTTRPSIKDSATRVELQQVTGDFLTQFSKKERPDATSVTDWIRSKQISPATLEKLGGEAALARELNAELEHFHLVHETTFLTDEALANNPVLAEVVGTRAQSCKDACLQAGTSFAKNPELLKYAKHLSESTIGMVDEGGFYHLSDKEIRARRVELTRDLAEILKTQSKDSKDVKKYIEDIRFENTATRLNDELKTYNETGDPQRRSDAWNRAQRTARELAAATPEFIRYDPEYGARRLGQHLIDLQLLSPAELPIHMRPFPKIDPITPIRVDAPVLASRGGTKASDSLLGAGILTEKERGSFENKFRKYESDDLLTGLVGEGRSTSEITENLALYLELDLPKTTEKLGHAKTRQIAEEYLTRNGYGEAAPKPGALDHLLPEAKVHEGVEGQWKSASEFLRDDRVQAAVTRLGAAENHDLASYARQLESCPDFAGMEPLGLLGAGGEQIVIEMKPRAKLSDGTYVNNVELKDGIAYKDGKLVADVKDIEHPVLKVFTNMRADFQENWGTRTWNIEGKHGTQEIPRDAGIIDGPIDLQGDHVVAYLQERVRQPVSEADVQRFERISGNKYNKAAAFDWADSTTKQKQLGYALDKTGAVRRDSNGDPIVVLVDYPALMSREDRLAQPQQD